MKPRLRHNPTVRPFYIGPVLIDPPIVLAPMEDVTNAAYRAIAKRIGGPGLMVTEFISAMAVRYAPSRSVPKMRVLDEERPLAVQIFGSDPQVMAETARIAEAMGADIVDINMGCWVPKVCRQGSGAALLKDPDQALAVVEAVVAAVQVPVTVKVRAGWDHAHLASVSLAPLFERAGARAITLHARTARQGFTGRADWSLIGEMRRAVAIPVIGNGDIRTPLDAQRMFDETGCDGVMIGRAAIANPWFLAQVRDQLAGTSPRPDPDFEERRVVAMEHLERHIEQLGNEERAVRSLRAQLPGYFRGFEGAARLRERISRACTVADVLAALVGLGPKS